MGQPFHSAIFHPCRIAIVSLSTTTVTFISVLGDWPGPLFRNWHTNPLFDFDGNKIQSQQQVTQTVSRTQQTFLKECKILRDLQKLFSIINGSRPITQVVITAMTLWLLSALPWSLQTNIAFFHSPFSRIIYCWLLKQWKFKVWRNSEQCCYFSNLSWNFKLWNI